jgi:hypothetical protein
MTLPMQITRRSLLRLVPAAGACFLTRAAAAAAPRTGEGLEPFLSSGQLHVAAPQLRFVSGPALERLENGAPVPFALQLALSSDRFSTIQQRDIERFVVSYDLWEQKFSIVRLGRPRKTVSHLAPRDAEKWCVGQLGLAPAGVSSSTLFWLRLEARAENPAEDSFASNEDAMSLTRLVEIFSRRSRTDANRWSVEAGPFRLASLRRPAETEVLK